MADRVVLVNGLPASGKTTLATALAEQLEWVLLSKDAILAPLASLAWPRVSSDALGGLALDTMYSLAAAVDGGVILDSIWLSSRDRPFLERGLATMGEPRVIEVWCRLPEALARERFERRRPERHPVHGAWRPGFWDEAVAVTDDPVIVDTAGEVDVAALAARVRAAVAP
jgi:glucokinase